jgi:WD40 repeat protein
MQKIVVLSCLLGLAWLVGDRSTLAADNDAQGDPTPKDAMQRFGTIRFRGGDKLLCLAYSPDGTILASGGRNDPVRLWNAQTGQLLRTLPEQMVFALAFSPDGNQLVTGGANKIVRLWDVANGKEVRHMKGHKASIKTLAFSREAIVSGSDDNTVRLWSPNDGTELSTYQGHTFGITAVAIAPDLTSLASASNDHTIRIWNGQQKTITAPTAVTAVVYLKKKTLVSGGDDGMIRVWDIDKQKEVRKWKGHSDTITHMALSSDGQTFITAGADKLVKVWDVNTGNEVRAITRRLGDCEALAVTSDGKQVAGGGFNCTVRRWDATTGNVIPGPSPQEGVVTSLACSPDGGLIAAGLTTNTVLLYDSAGKEKFRLDCGKDDAEVLLAFAASGKTLATLSSADGVILWNAGNGTETKRLPPAERDEARCLAVSPDGQRVAVGYTSGGVRVWEAGGKMIKQLPVLHGARAVAWSSDGKVLAIGADDFIVLHDAGSFEELRRYAKLNDTVSCLAFSPDNRILAAGLFANAIRLFDLGLPKDKEVDPKLLEGHIGVVNALAWSANGRCLASAGFDKTVRTWEFVNGQPIALWPGHLGEATAVAFHPSGRTVISGGRDTSLLVWDATGGLRGKLPEVKELNEVALDGLWKDMASDTNAKGNAALWAMATAKGAATWLDKSKKIFVEDPSKIKKYVDDLNSDKFKDREAANVALANYGRWVEGVLRKVLENPPSEEVRQRVERLLARLEGKEAISLQQERLRVRRAIEMLEQSGVEESRELLQKLAAGAAEDDLRDMARAAFERVSKK